uniref:Uncharacterized protein n=1 Tax=Arundo donax TaxID=35708 RepID=A0A0A9F1Q1_ARUDO
MQCCAPRRLWLVTSIRRVLR